ncbi:MAG: KUP/HAK/KT family potassium transporter, partial [Alphaproteobacteria bacterium]|nr:KUP/HAK/KT family potassium transporter [Alphaproteobacteria bacterium]
QIGQVYIPSLNILLMISTILLVLIFKTSSNLAAAYGLVVSAIMLMTSILIMMVANYFWEWKVWKIGLIFSPLIVIDVFYCSVNLAKIFHGGWLPLLIALGVYGVMYTWYKCRQELKKEIKKNEMTFDELLLVLKEGNFTKKKGTAVYITPIQDSIPTALKLGLLHYQTFHERIILLTITTKDVPTVNSSQRLTTKEIFPGIYQVNAYYGFKETPHVFKLISNFCSLNANFNPHNFYFFISRVFPIRSSRKIFKGWKERVFVQLARNSMNPTEFYHIPPEHAIELVTRIKI